MADVSIIVPVYNVESYLAMCLDSLTCQSFEDIEIICINDGSTDNSLEILEHYQKFDRRIKIINKENGGLSSARNVGIKTANGDYILFVDSDDWISSNAVERLYENAQKNNSDLVIFDFCCCDYSTNRSIITTIENYHGKYENKPFNKNTIETRAYKYIPVSAWSKLYKTDLIKGKIEFYEDIIFEDVPFWAYIYSHAKRITYLAEPLYFYRKNREGSIMCTKGEKFFDIIKAYDRVESILKDSGDWDKCKPAVQLLMVMDFILRLYSIAPEFREELFNRIKSLNKNIDEFLFEESSFAQIERASVEKFKLLNSVDYKTFNKILFEVKND